MTNSGKRCFCQNYTLIRKQWTVSQYDIITAQEKIAVFCGI